MPVMSEARREGELTAKQERFVQEYAADCNATQAAIRAGYSERTASEQASRLLTKVNVQAAIQEARARLQQRAEITADRVVRELACVGFFTPKSLLDPDGAPIPLKDMPDDVACAISSMRVSYTEEPDSDGVFRRVKHADYRFCDKLKALESLGRHLGLFQDTTHVNVLVRVVRQVESMSDAELRALLDRARGAAALPPPGGGRAEEAGGQRP